MKRGSYTKQLSSEWLRELLHFLGAPAIIVCDNSGVHNGFEDVVADFRDSTILRLAPYSPCLNAIEHIWSIVKQQIKNQIRLDPFVRADVGTLAEQRMRYLERLGHMAMEGLTVPHIISSCNHVRQHCAALLQLHDITG